MRLSPLCDLRSAVCTAAIVALTAVSPAFRPGFFHVGTTESFAKALRSRWLCDGLRPDKPEDHHVRRLRWLAAFERHVDLRWQELAADSDRGRATAASRCCRGL